MPRKAKSITDIASYARQHTETAVNVLLAIASSPQASDAARVAAANGLLDRGWGKPKSDISIAVNTDETAISEQLNQLFGLTIEGESRQIQAPEATHKAPETSQ